MQIDEFISELKKINIDITEKQLIELKEYYNLLIEYNKHTNLTRIVEQQDVYLKHFYDSLTIVNYVDFNNINNILDIGTGAGFPGMPLKILYPDVEFVLFDSLNKRINFSFCCFM